MPEASKSWRPLRQKLRFAVRVLVPYVHVSDQLK